VQYNIKKMEFQAPLFLHAFKSPN